MDDASESPHLMTSMFVVGRNALQRTQWLETARPALQERQARLRIDRFALTSNNITYGAFGESMSYWKFFPTGDDASGCIPVWGFATATESRCAGVAAGERFYGYFPIADQLVVTPERVDAAGFVDAAPHRRELPGAYNRYLRCSADPIYRQGDEALLALLRPLFVTSFLIDDFLLDNRDFGAASVVMSSASSKTAYGLGFCLGARAGGAATPQRVGLTSAANLAFTRGLGCYDEVLTYNDIATLPRERTAVYVDFSGDAALRAAIHHHWEDRLAYSCAVGGTHWQALGGAKGLPGPRPVLFFAPAQAKKRAAEWGAEVLQQRLSAAWTAFRNRVADPEHPWLRVVEGRGRDAVESTYAELLAGRVPAEEGRMLAV